MQNLIVALVLLVNTSLFALTSITCEGQETTFPRVDMKIRTLDPTREGSVYADITKRTSETKSQQIVFEGTLEERTAKGAYHIQFYHYENGLETEENMVSDGLLMVSSEKEGDKAKSVFAIAFTGKAGGEENPIYELLCYNDRATSSLSTPKVMKASYQNHCVNICQSQRSSCSLSCNITYGNQITARELCYSNCRTEEYRCLSGC